MSVDAILVEDLLIARGLDRLDEEKAAVVDIAAEGEVRAVVVTGDDGGKDCLGSSNCEDGRLVRAWRCLWGRVDAQLEER